MTDLNELNHPDQFPAALRDAAQKAYEAAIELEAAWQARAGLRRPFLWLTVWQKGGINHSAPCHYRQKDTPCHARRHISRRRPYPSRSRGNRSKRDPRGVLGAGCRLVNAYWVRNDL